MRVPNLAARPFLNTRPVWVVTAVALAVMLVMIAVNLRFYVVSNRVLAERIEERSDLSGRHELLATEVRDNLRALERVPWGSLASRVRAVNDVLREGAFSWLDLLGDLERVMPYDVRIVRVSPRVDEKAVKLQLEAICKTREDLLDFLQRLIDDPSFSEPTPQSETPPEESDEPYYSLALNVSYHPDRGEQP